MKSNSNTSIKCNVESCKHHNCENYCCLNDINVGSDTKEAKAKYETECMSFECSCNQE